MFGYTRKSSDPHLSPLRQRFALFSSSFYLYMRKLKKYRFAYAVPHSHFFFFILSIVRRYVMSRQFEHKTNEADMLCCFSSSPFTLHRDRDKKKKKTHTNIYASLQVAVVAARNHCVRLGWYFSVSVLFICMYTAMTK